MRLVPGLPRGAQAARVPPGRPGLAAGRAGDALASVVQEAYSAFESVVRPPQRPRPVRAFPTLRTGRVPGPPPAPGQTPPIHRERLVVCLTIGIDVGGTKAAAGVVAPTARSLRS